MRQSTNGLVVVARNGEVAVPDPDSIETSAFFVEEIEQPGLPDFKFFTAPTEQELEIKVRQWRDEEVANNPTITGVIVMSPTVSEDGMWRTTVNFLVFEESMDPWQ